MKVNSILSAAMNTSGEQSVESEPTFFTVTPNTIRVGHGSEIFQIKNITRIGKYKIAENKFPLILIIICLLAGLGSLATQSGVGVFFGICLLAVAGFGLWSRSRPGTYAFGFECNSGAARYFHTKDEKFIEEIVGVVSQYIESEQAASLQINVVDRSVVNTGIIGGNVQTGDSK